jgi:hypothetical protein
VYERIDIGWAGGTCSAYVSACVPESYVEIAALIVHGKFKLAAPVDRRGPDDSFGLHETILQLGRDQLAQPRLDGRCAPLLADDAHRMTRDHRTGAAGRDRAGDLHFITYLEEGVERYVLDADTASPILKEDLFERAVQVGDRAAKADGSLRRWPG